MTAPQENQLNPALVIRLVSQKSKISQYFPRNSCSKGFARFQVNISGGVHRQKAWHVMGY